MITVHDPSCHEAAGLPVARARSVDPLAKPHRCLPQGFAQTHVAVDKAEVPEHEYAESMIWPAGASRALCSVCRETH